MTTSPIILLIDPDLKTGESVKAALSSDVIMQVPDRNEAFQFLSKHSPDLILLEVNLPEQSGLQLCSELFNHPQYQEIPIVILSSNVQKSEIALGLSCGADDYITKPFDPIELKYRIEARLRRRRLHSKVVTAGPFHFDLELHQCVYRNGAEERAFDFTTAEFLIFFLLAKHPDHVFSREEIVHDLWKRKGLSIDPKGINTHVAHLRRKLGNLKEVIRSYYGRGYSFSQPNVLSQLGR